MLKAINHLVIDTLVVKIKFKKSTEDDQSIAK